MTERDIKYETPVAVLQSLVAAAGGTPWLGVAGVFAEDGQDVISEAEWYAERGVLSGAAAFAYFSRVPNFEKIELIRDLAAKSLEHILAKKKESGRDRITAKRAQAVIEISSDYISLNTQTKPS